MNIGWKEWTYNRHPTHKGSADTDGIRCSCSKCWIIAKPAPCLLKTIRLGGGCLALIFAIASRLAAIGTAIMAVVLFVKWIWNG
ncbi:MAG: hypothetical protein DMG77_03500 [Acidobacteria bacterium]|nr:MAG: hypothetical protein DMG77_03500 [Acidobacteriota bacterium]